jgi:hypothetical protein
MQRLSGTMPLLTVALMKSWARYFYIVSQVEFCNSLSQFTNRKNWSFRGSSYPDIATAGGICFNDSSGTRIGETEGSDIASMP